MDYPSLNNHSTYISHSFMEKWCLVRKNGWSSSQPKKLSEIFLEVPLCFDKNALFIHPIPSNKIFKKQILKGWNLINWWLLLLPANAGDANDSGSTPGSGKLLEVGNGSPLQYSLLGNSVDKGTWPWDCKELHMTEQLSKQHSPALSRTFLSETGYFFCFFLSARVVVNGVSQVALVIKTPPSKGGDVRDPSSIPGSGRSPEGGHGNPLQCSCLENPHGQRSPERYSPYGFKESDMT